MLQNIQLIPKIGHSLVPSILTCIGLKQGDNLSPLEFKEIFDEKCDPLRQFPGIVSESFIV